MQPMQGGSAQQPNMPMGQMAFMQNSTQFAGIKPDSFLRSRPVPQASWLKRVWDRIRGVSPQTQQAVSTSSSSSPLTWIGGICAVGLLAFIVHKSPLGNKLGKNLGNNSKPTEDLVKQLGSFSTKDKAVPKIVERIKALQKEDKGNTEEFKKLLTALQNSYSDIQRNALEAFGSEAPTEFLITLLKDAFPSEKVISKSVQRIKNLKTAGKENNEEYKKLLAAIQAHSYYAVKRDVLKALGSDAPPEFVKELLKNSLTCDEALSHIQTHVQGKGQAYINLMNTVFETTPWYRKRDIFKGLDVKNPAYKKDQLQVYKAALEHSNVHIQEAISDHLENYASAEEIQELLKLINKKQHPDAHDCLLNLQKSQGKANQIEIDFNAQDTPTRLSAINKIWKIPSEEKRQELLTKACKDTALRSAAIEQLWSISSQEVRASLFNGILADPKISKTEFISVLKNMKHQTYNRHIAMEPIFEKALQHTDRDIQLAALKYSHAMSLDAGSRFLQTASHHTDDEISLDALLEMSKSTYSSAFTSELGAARCNKIISILNDETIRSSVKTQLLDSLLIFDDFNHLYPGYLTFEQKKKIVDEAFTSKHPDVKQKAEAFQKAYDRMKGSAGPGHERYFYHQDKKPWETEPWKLDPSDADYCDEATFTALFKDIKTKEADQEKGAQLKSNYKKLSLKLHPDRQLNKLDQEQPSLPKADRNKLEKQYTDQFQKMQRLYFEACDQLGVSR